MSTLNGSTLTEKVLSGEQDRLAQRKALTLRTKLETLKDIGETRDDFTLLVYDIAQTLTVEGKVANPSSVLWRHGFRLNLSCWVLPNREVDSPGIRELLDHWSDYPGEDGVKWEFIPFHEKAVAKVRALAQQKLEEELVAQGISLLSRMFDAQKALEQKYKELDAACSEGKEVSFAQYEAADAKWVSHTRAILKDAQKDLGNLEECVHLFEEEGEGGRNKLGLEALFNGLRNLNALQRELFNAETLMKNQPSKVLPEIALLGTEMPLSHLLQKNGRTYTFFPLPGGEETVIVLTAPPKPRQKKGEETPDTGELWGKDRRRVLVQEARDFYRRLLNEGWTKAE